MFLLMAINLLGSFLENWVRFLQVCYLVSSDHINVGSYLKQNVKAIRMIWIRLSGDFIDGVIYLCVLLSFSFLSLPFPYLPTQALLKKVADLCHQHVRKCHLWHRSTDPPHPSSCIISSPRNVGARSNFPSQKIEP